MSFDKSYYTDSTDAVVKSIPISAHLILISAAFCILSFIIWANLAVLDEVTRGDGRVIPSSNLQVVQNLEGGIISRIYVQEGELVAKGQVLMDIDDTRFSSTLRENDVAMHALQIKMLRLSAQAQGRDFKVPNELTIADSKRIESERNLFNSQSRELNARVDVYQTQKYQKEQELKDAQSRSSRIFKNLELMKKELDLSIPLFEEGVVSEVELLRLKRSVNDMESELKSNQISIPRLKSSINETLGKIKELNASYKTHALDEFNSARNELMRLKEENIALKDKVSRTTVRSPVRGTVNQIKKKTLGSVVQGGQDLVEIVPTEDSLLIEASIKPSDIGFLIPGMPVTVKISAYDFSIYGGLEGKVDTISADSIRQENGESFYKVIVRTNDNKLIYKGKELDIIPGMSASVDILTGHKTVMDYILKPLLKTRNNAMTER